MRIVYRQVPGGTSPRGTKANFSSDSACLPCCGRNLIKSFSTAEAEVVLYVAANQQKCGIAPQMVSTIQSDHANTVRMQTQVCSAAAAPQRQSGPGLSEALGQARGGQPGFKSDDMF